MASYRCGFVLIAGFLLIGPGVVCAQQSGSPSYDQLLAQQQQAKAAADAKTGKTQNTAPVDATTPAVAATPAAAPDTAPAAAPAAATPTQPADAAAAPPPAATDGATVTPSADAPPANAAAAGGDVPPVSTAKDDAKFKPVKLGKDKDGKEKGKKAKKEKPPKLVPVDIVHGELTVDGLIAKAGLNFQILDLKYLYIWVPGLGTAIVSNNPFAGATLQADALDGSTLTVMVDGHKLQLACDRPMLVTKDEKKEEVKEEKRIDRGQDAKAKGAKPGKPNKKDKALPMYVAIDRNWQKPSNYPEFGYGDLVKAPYSWPGTLADLNPNTKAPALPDNLKQHPESVKICGKDGEATSCREVSVPLVLGKAS